MVEFNIKFECSDCGEELPVEHQVTNSVFVISPCACTLKVKKSLDDLASNIEVLLSNFNDTSHTIENIKCDFEDVVNLITNKKKDKKLRLLREE